MTTDEQSGPTPEEKPVVGATESVDVGGSAGTTEVLARADTGAARTSIDTELAAQVGAGPITGVTRVRSAGSETARARSLVDLLVRVAGDPHVVVASVEDRGHMRYPLLLGRDVLGHYHVDASRRADEREDG